MGCLAQSELNSVSTIIGVCVCVCYVIKLLVNLQELKWVGIYSFLA